MSNDVSSAKHMPQCDACLKHTTTPPLNMLLDALSQNGYAHESSTLRDIIGDSAQDAQYSRAASEHVEILRRFRSLEHLTVRELMQMRTEAKVE